MTVKPHLRMDRGVWICRECIRVQGFYNVRRLHFLPYRREGPTGHGYTVREACEDWKAQMQAQRA